MRKHGISARSDADRIRRGIMTPAARNPQFSHFLTSNTPHSVGIYSIHPSGRRDIPSPRQNFNLPSKKRPQPLAVFSKKHSPLLSIFPSSDIYTSIFHLLKTIYVEQKKFYKKSKKNKKYGDKT
jgi:hypothetical protein